MSDTVASIYFLRTNGPDGSKWPVAVAENLWLGPTNGWSSGTGVVLYRDNGTPTTLPADSIYKTYRDPAECELLNVLTCPAITDARDEREQMIQTWREHRTVTIPWRHGANGVLVLRAPTVEGRRLSVLPTDHDRNSKGIPRTWFADNSSLYFCIPAASSTHQRHRLWQGSHRIIFCFDEKLITVDEEPPY